MWLYHSLMTSDLTHIPTHSEGHDRNEISLPGMQEQLLATVKKSISANVPVVVVLMSGSTVDISWAQVCGCEFCVCVGGGSVRGYTLIL